MPKHSSRKHATLSASGSSRWLKCTPSVRLSDGLVKKSSVYANEGTLAHEFADVNLRFINQEITAKQFNDQLADLRTHELYFSGMEDYVEDYVSYVVRAHKENMTVDPGAEMTVEERLDFSHVVPDGFGTGDALLVASEMIEVIDLKFGQGVVVYAEDNSQLMLYALGALRKYEMLYDIRTIKMTIVQPRRESISSWSITSEKLLDWAETYVRPRAEMANKGEGELVTGDHCRWCPVNKTCSALHGEATKIAQHEFASPKLLPASVIQELYPKIELMRSWLKSLQDHVEQSMVSGDLELEGYKVVESKGRRKWSNEEAVIEALKDMEFEAEEYLNLKLLGITRIAQLLDTDTFEELIAPHIHRPAGKPKIVKTSDNRPAMGVDQAVEDFS